MGFVPTRPWGFSLRVPSSASMHDLSEVCARWDPTRIVLVSSGATTEALAITRTDLMALEGAMLLHGVDLHGTPISTAVVSDVDEWLRTRVHRSWADVTSTLSPPPSEVSSLSAKDDTTTCDIVARLPDDPFVPKTAIVPRVAHMATRALWLGSLSPDMQRHELVAVLARFGWIERLHLSRPRNMTHPVWAKVLYRDQATATHAFASLRTMPHIPRVTASTLRLNFCDPDSFYSQICN